MEPKYDYQELALQLQLAGLLDDKSVVGAAGNEDVLKALVDGKLAEHALTVSEDGKTLVGVKAVDEQQGDSTTSEEAKSGPQGEADQAGDVFEPIEPVLQEGQAQDIGENGTPIAKTSEAPGGNAPAPVSPTEQASDIDVIAATSVSQAPGVINNGIQDQSSQDQATAEAPKGEDVRFSDGNTAGKIVNARLAEYIAAMEVNKPITERDGARWQSVLYRQITSTINRPDNFFEENFENLLRLFRENAKGVFGPASVTRFLDEIELTPEDRQAFECLVHLLAMVADPRSRQQALKQIDVNMALAHGVTEQGRQRVADYLGARI